MHKKADLLGMLFQKVLQVMIVYQKLYIYKSSGIETKKGSFVSVSKSRPSTKMHCYLFLLHFHNSCLNDSFVFELLSTTNVRIVCCKPLNLDPFSF